MQRSIGERPDNPYLSQTTAETLRAKEKQNAGGGNEAQSANLRLVADVSSDGDEAAEEILNFPNESDYPNYNKSRLLKTRHEFMSERLKHLELFLKKEPQGDELAWPQEEDAGKSGEDLTEEEYRMEFKAKQAKLRREEGGNKPESDIAIEAEIKETREKLAGIESMLAHYAPEAISEGEDYLKKLTAAVIKERKNIQTTRKSSVPSTEDMIPDTLDELNFFRKFLEERKLSGTNGQEA